jgi:hypothetical protein
MAPDEIERPRQPVWRSEPTGGGHVAERPYCPVCLADPDAVDPNGYPIGTLQVLPAGVLVCQRYGAAHYRADIDAVRQAAPRGGAS